MSGALLYKKSTLVEFSGINILIWTTLICCELVIKSIPEWFSLLGSLPYTVHCICPARILLKKKLRDNVHKSRFVLTQDFLRDLNWFSAFLTQM